MGELGLFLPLLVVMGAFMFFASRRQKKAMQATVALHDSLVVGDRVMTATGLFGTIAGISDQNVDLEVAPGVITTWTKMAIRDRVQPDEGTSAIVDDVDPVEHTDDVKDADDFGIDDFKDDTETTSTSRELGGNGSAADASDSPRLTKD